MSAPGTAPPAVALEAGLVCRDLDRMRDFCVAVLGFAQAEEVVVPDIGTILKLRRAQARLKLFAPLGEVATTPVPDPATWWRPGGWRYGTLYVESDAAVTRIAESATRHGSQILIPPQSYRPGSFVALLADPEHNPWEILHQTGGPDRVAPQGS